MEIEHDFPTTGSKIAGLIPLAVITKWTIVHFGHIVCNMKPTSPTSSRVQELPAVSATTLKNSIGDVFEKVGSVGAVAITRHDKARAVLVSVEEYEGLTAYKRDAIKELEEEYWQMVLRMRTPKAQEAMARLMRATPEELGEAAVEGANRYSLQ